MAPSSVTPFMLIVSLAVGSMVAKSSVLKGMCLASLCAMRAEPIADWVLQRQMQR